VVLRGLRRGLVFFTDGQSDKGAELAANPRAAAVLHWLVPAHRQVRVAGPVEPVSEDEADQYWSTRAPAARLSAAASRQSRVVASRTVLETQVRDMLRRHPGGAGVPRPRRWGGFRVLPSRVEFWQESPDGLHDRIRYRQTGNGWIIERLSP
jgi:pyridoxamine 5'-phosphate oxidase